MKQATNKRRLGRGLEALLGPSVTEAKAGGSLGQISLELIEPNPYQPRNSIDEAALEELKASLRSSGLLQPVVVRPHGDGRYQLIAGERRARAAQSLGWKTIGAVVRDVDDQTLLTLALVENLQRDSLSPIDEAKGYARLISGFGVSQMEVAELVGRDRSTVANSIRLLKLPGGVQELVHSGALSTGHARALLRIHDNGSITRLAKHAVDEKLSVRQLESLARNNRPPKRRPRGRANGSGVDPEVRRIEDTLRRYLKTDVFISTRSKESGKVAFNFYSSDDLARLLELILKRPYE